MGIVRLYNSSRNNHVRHFFDEFQNATSPHTLQLASALSCRYVSRQQKERNMTAPIKVFWQPH